LVRTTCVEEVLDKLKGDTRVRVSKWSRTTIDLKIVPFIVLTTMPITGGSSLKSSTMLRGPPIGEGLALGNEFSAPIVKLTPQASGKATVIIIPHPVKSVEAEITSPCDFPVSVV
jgi:hypothetical protein